MLEVWSHNKILVSRLGIRLFNSRWPGSLLEESRTYYFEFDDDENLIDTDVPEHSDGPWAVALAEDCKNWHFYNEKPDWM